MTAQTIPEFVFASRGNHALVVLMVLCMMWFVALYTGKTPKPLLAGISVALAIVIVAALALPYGVQFDQISEMHRMILPWGEAYFKPQGSISLIYKLGLLALFAGIGYMVYAMLCLVRAEPTRNNRGMLFAAVFFLICFAEAALARSAVIDFLPLGPYGILGFIIVMSMGLNQAHSEALKAAAQAIEQEHKRLETILKTSSDDICILDAEGVLIEANDAFLRTRGLDKSAIGQLHASAWNAQFDRETLTQRIRAMLESDARQTFETRHRRIDGSVFDVEIIASAFSFDGARYLFHAVRDISERKSYQQELERRVAARTAELATARAEAETANAVKTRFMANVSHEMKTPMNGILGFAEIGKRKAEAQSAEAFGGYFDKILESGMRLNRLMESLFSLAQDAWNQQAGMSEEELETVMPETLVIQCISRMEKTAVAKQQGIVFENTSTIPVIQGDESRLRQVLEHLLNNALRYSPEGTTVTVKIQDKVPLYGLPTEISIQVIDQGCGVPEQEMQAIFEPFYQSSRTATGAGGTGLGLALCKSIVQRHKGTLSVRNRPEGGAIFEITLPKL